MKQKIEQIKRSWTWNHKMFILTLGLAVAHVWPHIPLPELKANTVSYVSSGVQQELGLAYQIEQRAIELYEENRDMDLEKYRHDAISELNRELQKLVNDSPFINYEELKEKFGY
jgi:hypothetical protein